MMVTCILSTPLSTSLARADAKPTTVSPPAPEKYKISSISFCSVMSFAEHLTVTNISSPTFTPCCHMVGIHVFQVPDLGMICIVTNSTKRTVALPFFFSSFRLLSIYSFFRWFVEYSHVQQFGVLATIKHILIDSFPVFHIKTLVEFLYLCSNHSWIVGGYLLHCHGSPSRVQLRDSPGAWPCLE